MMEMVIERMRKHGQELKCMSGSEKKYDEGSENPKKEGEGTKEKEMRMRFSIFP